MADGTPIIIKKKKGHGGHAHHGGSWKVAYADFVTAMMAFFMVMWIMGLSEDTRNIVQGYFNDPSGFVKAQPRSRNIINTGMAGSPSGKKNKDGERQASAAAAAEAEMRKLKREIEEELERAAAAEGTSSIDLKTLLKDVEITVDPDGLRIDFIEKNGEVFFKIGSAEIRPAARTLVSKIAPILARSGRMMVFDGHTDSRPLDRPNYNNMDLSTDRAAALRRTMVACGVRPAQVLMERGHADRQLRDPSNPLSFVNRRVSVLLPFDPSMTDGVGKLPKEALHDKVEAVFRKPVEIAPPVLDRGESGH